MKKLLILSVVLFSSVMVFAQNGDSNDQKSSTYVGTNVNYRNGYRADIELSCIIPHTWAITSSHGYSFGNGLYVGGGAGFSAEFLPDYNTMPSYIAPVFADLKYSFINRLQVRFSIFAQVRRTT